MVDLNGVSLRTSVDGDVITLEANSLVSGPLALDEIPSCRPDLAFGGKWTWKMALSPVVAVALKDKLTMARDAGARLLFRSREEQHTLALECRKLPKAVGVWDHNNQRLVVDAPNTNAIRSLMRKTSATPRSDGTWSIPVTKLRDFIELNDALPPHQKVELGDDVMSVVSESLPAPYDGTAESLKKLPVSTLRTVKSNSQSWSLLKLDRSTIEEKLHKMGVDSLYDLLMLRPKRYIDRSQPQDVRDLIEGETATIVGRVVEWKKPSARLDVLVLEDSRGVKISCSYFNCGWMRNKYKPGDEVIAVGQYKPWRPPSGHSNRVYPQLAQPAIDPVEAAGALPIMPVYHTPAKAALSSTIIMHCEQELISRLGDKFRGPRWADPALKANHVTDVDYGTALKRMHLPKSTDSMEDAQAALAFCEIVQLLVWIEASRNGTSSRPGVRCDLTGELLGAYEKALPYKLTGAQSRAVEKIKAGMASDERLHALLVGDVGSGKTTVMHMAALAAVEGGHQAVVCAPTEILAQQLYEEFVKTWSLVPEPIRSKVTCRLHADYKGQVEALKKAQETDPTVNDGKKPTAAGLRRQIVKGVADGSINLVFGTHAVLNLDYHDLGFVGVDEQHKFGAKQRSRLLKIRPDGRTPNMLMQTATPIPRSMAQVYYGDVEYLRLDEMPAGRQPIETVWVKSKGQDVVDDPDNEIWRDVAAETRLGHGVFVVCPMVADSEKTDAASVRRTAEELRAMFKGKLRVEAVYGGQAKDKQDANILGFKNGTVDMLVASSVVEVGVSCPKATRMVVLDANRFGLASLHQIRGRIGRSTLKSKCWLVALPFNDVASRRMQAMVDTLDGWTLSKTDLKNRGAGSLFSDRQSGTSDLMFADLVTDAKWIEPARRTARDLLRGPDAVDVIEESRKYFGIEKGQEILS